MSTTLKSFAAATQLTTSEQTLASTGSTEKAFIGKVTFTNTSAAAVEVTVWILAAATTGTTGSGGNWKAKRTLQPNEEWDAIKTAGHVLGNSMKVSALAGTGAVINSYISGTVES